MQAEQTRYQGSAKDSKFDIDVVNPTKHGEGINQYVSYTVNTHTSMPGFASSDLSVVRRFRDFKFLHDSLVTKNRGIMVPPLPDKSIQQKFRPSDEALEMRRRDLEMFLTRVASHPELQKSDDFKMFLEATDSQWAHEYQKANGDLVAKGQGKLKDGIKIAQDLGYQGVNLVQGKGAATEETDQEYVVMREYVKHLETNMSQTQKQASTLMKQQKQLSDSIQQFGTVAVKLGKLEQGQLQEAFMQLGKSTEEVGKASVTAQKALGVQFEAPLREFVRMAKGVKGVVGDRAAAQRELQRLTADLNNKKAKLTKLQSAPGTKPELVTKAETDVQKAEESLRASEQTYATIKDRMANEMKRFQEERAEEMTYVMKQFALNQAKLANQNAKLWSDLLSQIQAQVA